MAQARGSSRLSRLRLPALALALPVVGLAALLATVAATHRSVSTPPAPVVIATPTPRATPTLYPVVFRNPDDFTLGPPHQFGNLDTPQVALPPRTSIVLSVATPPTSVPTELPVWKLAGAPLDPRSIADRFGISPADRALTENDMTSWRAGLGVDAVDGIIVWIPIGVPAPRLGGTPRDTESAANLALRWLQRSGLAPFAGAPAGVEQTSSGDSASLPEWTVTWHRTAPGYPQIPIDDVVARVSGDGTLKQLDFSHPPIVGGSLYRLRPWQDALRDAQANHWFQPCCEPVPDTTIGSLHITVSVSIQYALAQTAQGRFAIPMYAFTEGAGYQPGLVPAIAPMPAP